MLHRRVEKWRYCWLASTGVSVSLRRLIIAIFTYIHTGHNTVDVCVTGEILYRTILHLSFKMSSVFSIAPFCKNQLFIGDNHC